MTSFRDIFDDILKLSYLVSHLRRCVCAHVPTNLIGYLLRHLVAAQCTHQSPVRDVHPSTQHLAERSALVQWACANLRLQPNVIIWRLTHLVCSPIPTFSKNSRWRRSPSLIWIFGRISIVSEDIIVKFGTLIDIFHTGVTSLWLVQWQQLQHIW